MIICICHRISDRDITHAVRVGCASFDELQEDTRLGTACGACLDCAHQSFHEQAAAGRCGVTQMAAQALVASGG